jgi:hypothetical protein
MAIGSNSDMCNGLIIDDTLSWKQHIEYLIKKCLLHAMP